MKKSIQFFIITLCVFTSTGYGMETTPHSPEKVGQKRKSTSPEKPGPTKQLKLEQSEQDEFFPLLALPELPLENIFCRLAGCCLEDAPGSLNALSRTNNELYHRLHDPVTMKRVLAETSAYIQKRIEKDTEEKAMGNNHVPFFEFSLPLKEPISAYLSPLLLLKKKYIPTHLPEEIKSELATTAIDGDLWTQFYDNEPVGIMPNKHDAKIIHFFVSNTLNQDKLPGVFLLITFTFGLEKEFRLIHKYGTTMSDFAADNVKLKPVFNYNAMIQITPVDIQKILFQRVINRNKYRQS